MKRNLTFALVLLWAGLTGIAFAQTLEIKNQELPYIEVTGTAEKEVIPDEIYIGITLVDKAERKNKMTVEEQETKMKEALKNLGIDLKNLYLADADADYIRIRRKTGGVQTRKEYVLLVHDAATVGKVFQALDALEITDANINKVNFSKMDELRREVKILAMKAAKAKADYLLEAIGEATGKPLIVREVEDPYGMANVVNIRQNANVQYRVAAEMDDVGGGDPEIQFQKIKVQTTIYAKFAIR